MQNRHVSLGCTSAPSPWLWLWLSRNSWWSLQPLQAMSGSNCACQDFTGNFPNQPIDGCRSICESFNLRAGFIYSNTNNTCRCCNPPIQIGNTVTAVSLYTPVPPAPSGYDFKCGLFCRCADFSCSEFDLTIDVQGSVPARIHLRPVRSTIRKN